VLNGLIYRNIDSILQQNYSNYHVVYTDDASPEKTGKHVKEYLKSKGVEEGNFKVKINSEKKGMMENIFNAITHDCQLGEIAVMLDGDDSFIGTNVLSLLNAVYQKEKIALMWNNFLEITENKLAYMGFSRAIDDFKRYEGYLREKTLLLSSHLKSFYVDLFVKIKVSDLQEESGLFYGGASDTAIMIPMLEMSFPRFKYVPEIVYEYRMDTGHLGMIENREAQVRALIKISNSSSYL
jgi:glycosyltransferase involved in cell wall biosynthesis